MAESIYTQLENQAVVTPVDGIEYTHPLPEGLFPTSEQFGNKEQLIAWAEENDFTYPLLQKALQKAIIDVRACFKLVKKDQKWEEKLGLKNLTEMGWKTVNRPNATGEKVIAKAKLEAGIAMAQAMRTAKIADKTIMQALVPVYGDDGAKAIMAEIK